MDGTHAQERSPAQTADRFSLLPVEVLSEIFIYLGRDAPLALSRRLLPYSRTARLAHVGVSSCRQLQRLVATIKETPALGGYVRSFATDLMDEQTETLLALGTVFNDTLAEALTLLPTLKEVHAGDWMTTSFLLSENAAAQLNSLDFITYRLALLGRFERLRNVAIMVIPYDPGSSTATALDLFPALDLAPPALDMVPITTVDQLVLGGPLCDRRIVNILRAFRGVGEVILSDTFASQHVAPALAALDASAVRVLVLKRLVDAPPPVDVAPQETDWARFSSLQELHIGMPIASPSAIADALPGFSNLWRAVFLAGSDPTAALVQHLLANRPPLLREVILSHLTGEVGEPISSDTVGMVAAWYQDLLQTNRDDRDAVAPLFPLSHWRLPNWSPGFTPADADALFALARTAGVKLHGTIVSACLTNFVLMRQLDVWFSDDKDDDEMGDEAQAVMGMREFWDALALRYQARLLGSETGGQAQNEGMDHS